MVEVKAKFKCVDRVRIVSLPEFSDRKLRKLIGKEAMVVDVNKFGSVGSTYFVYTLMLDNIEDLKVWGEHIELVARAGEY